LSQATTGKKEETLQEQVRKPEEGRPKEGSETLTLIDMEVRKDQSSNWQRIASIPEEKFEEYIQTKMVEILDKANL